MFGLAHSFICQCSVSLNTFGLFIPTIFIWWFNFSFKLIFTVQIRLQIRHVNRCFPLFFCSLSLSVALPKIWSVDKIYRNGQRLSSSKLYFLFFYSIEFLFNATLTNSYITFVRNKRINWISRIDMTHFKSEFSSIVSHSTCRWLKSIESGYYFKFRKNEHYF